MSDKKLFLELDYVLHRERGWDNKAREEFEDAFIELVESFQSVAAGTSSAYTEEQYESLHIGDSNEEEE